MNLETYKQDFQNKTWSMERHEVGQAWHKRQWEREKERDTEDRDTRATYIDKEA